MSGQMLDPDAVFYGQNPPGLDPRESESERPVHPLEYGPSPQPDPNVTGPAMSEQVRPLAETEIMGRVLQQIAYRDYRVRENDQRVNFAFDSSGNIKVVLYQSPVGNISKLSRVAIDVQGFTPASPYAAGTAWMGIYRGGGQTNQLQPYSTGAAAAEHDAAIGNLLDFGPAVAGGPLFPGLFEYTETSGPRVFGGQSFVLFVLGTAALANKQASAYVRAVDVVQL